MRYTFHTADAFTNQHFHGAQIAVFPEADGLDAEQMQMLAAELNLSETAFVLRIAGRPDARRVRLFSPQVELDFAGHPIIAAGAVLAEVGDLSFSDGHAMLVFEMNSSAVDVRIETRDPGSAFVQFRLSVKPLSDRFVPRPEEMAACLGLEVAEVDHHEYQPSLVVCDRPYLVVPLRSYEAVRRASFSDEGWSRSSAPALMADEMLLFSTHASD
jgi:trans-2,3-dihydro-3-hydroxyanthranilate isomerase